MKRIAVFVWLLIIWGLIVSCACQNEVGFSKNDIESESLSNSSSQPKTAYEDAIPEAEINSSVGPTSTQEAIENTPKPAESKQKATSEDMGKNPLGVSETCFEGKEQSGLDQALAFTATPDKTPLYSLVPDSTPTLTLTSTPPPTLTSTPTSISTPTPIPTPTPTSTPTPADALFRSAHEGEDDEDF